MTEIDRHFGDRNQEANSHRRLMKRHGHLWVWLFLSFLLFSCGRTEIRPAAESPAPSGASGVRLFNDAEQSFKIKSYRKALTLYNEYLARFPDGPHASLSLMREGEIYRSWKDYRTAKKTFQYVIDRYGESPQAPRAMVRIVETLYDEGAFPEAVSAADAFLGRLKDRTLAAEILMVKGDASLAMGNPPEAVLNYDLAMDKDAKAADGPAGPRLNKAFSQLSAADVTSLLERVKTPKVRGHLLFRLAEIEVEEGRTDDAARTLAQFVEVFPDHERTASARRMLEEFKGRAFLPPLPGGEEVQGEGRGGLIGCLLPLSGSYQVYGNRAQKGIELAIGGFGGRTPPNFILKDTASNPEQTRAAVEELVQSGASVIIGPIMAADEAARAAQDFKVPIITLTQKDGICEIGDYVFRHFITPRMQVRAVAAYAMESLGFSRFAVLYPDEKYGATFMTLFAGEIAARGGRVVASEPYGAHQTDFGKPIRALTRQGPFEALFIPDAPAKAGLIIPQLAFYDAGGVQLMGTNLWHSPKLFQLAKRFAEGAVVPDIFFPDSRDPDVRRFVADYTANYGEPPGFIEALAFDTVRMVLRLFSETDAKDPREVKDALIGMPAFKGVTGLTRFDASGEAEKSLFLLRVEGDRFVEIGGLKISRLSRNPQGNMNITDRTEASTALAADAP